MSTDHLLPALRSTEDDQSAAEVGGCIALVPRTQKIPEWDIITGISCYAADKSSGDPMAYQLAMNGTMLRYKPAGQNVSLPGSEVSSCWSCSPDYSNPFLIFKALHK